MHMCVCLSIFKKIIISDRNISHPCMVMTYYSFCSNSVCIEDRVIPSLLLYQKIKTHEQTLIHTYMYMYIDRQLERKTNSHTHKGVRTSACFVDVFFHLPCVSNENMNQIVLWFLCIYHVTPQSQYVAHDDFYAEIDLRIIIKNEAIH